MGIFTVLKIIVSSALFFFFILTANNCYIFFFQNLYKNPSNFYLYHSL